MHAVVFIQRFWVSKTFGQASTLRYWHGRTVLVLAEKAGRLARPFCCDKMLACLLLGVRKRVRG